jgi:hypothetical protein
MKKTILMLVIAAITMSAKAQVNKQKVGGYGAATADITWVNGSTSYNIGAYGAVLLNHKFGIGIAGNNIFYKQNVNGKKQNFQFNYYGLYTEYKIQAQKNVHVSLGLTGALGWQENDVISLDKTSRKDGDFTYVVKPKLALNISVAKFMQIQTYTTYRITGNTKSTYYNASNYNGISGGVALVFGAF